MSKETFTYSLDEQGNMTIYLWNKYTVADVQDVTQDQAESIMWEVLQELGYVDEQGNPTDKTRAYLN